MVDISNFFYDWGILLFFFIHFLGYKLIFFILIHIASLCHIYMLVHPSSLIMLLTLVFFHFLLVSNRLCSFLQFYYLVVLIKVPYCLGIFHLCFFLASKEHALWLIRTWCVGCEGSALPVMMFICASQFWPLTKM